MVATGRRRGQGWGWMFGCDDTDAVDVRTDTVDLMSFIKWCDVLKSGYDVIERRSVVMSS